MKLTHMASGALVLLLTACGPGTGGSGLVANARDFMSMAGAQASPVCSAAWSTQLSCEPPVLNQVVSANHPGTTKVQYASDASGSPEFVVSFEGNQVSLEGGCPRISYVGEWGQPEGKVASFYGSYLDASLIQSTLGVGAIKALPAGSDGAARLQVELRNDSGRLLVLLQLQKLSGKQTVPRSCP